MTVESTATKAHYQGNDAATEFPTGFAFAQDAHVRAVVRRPVAGGYEDVALALGADFGLSGAGTGVQGTLTYPLAGDPLAEGQTLTIYQDVPLTQEKSWNDLDVIDTAEIEKADDKLTRISLQLNEAISRCVQTPITQDAPDDYLGDCQAAQAAAAAAQAGAETAQAAAEEAETHAQAAQGAAEDARDAAQAAAAGVNLPALVAGDAGKVPSVKADESGYELLAVAEGGAGGLLRADGDGSSLSGVTASGVDLDPTPDGDHTASGTTLTFVAGEAINFPQLLRVGSAGKVYVADADAMSTMPVMYLALEDKSENQGIAVLVEGVVRDDSWAWTPGAVIYASTAAGNLTSTPPSGAGDVVQVVGVATHADRIHFRPSLVWGVIA